MRALFVCIKGQGRTHVVALEGRTLCGAEMPDEAAIFRGVPVPSATTRKCADGVTLRVTPTSTRSP